MPPRPARRTRTGLLLAGLLLAVTGCGNAAPSAPDTAPDAALPVAEQPAPSPREDAPSALDDPRDPSFPKPLIDPDEIRPGGPPPDGIPPIDEPTFERASRVTWLEDDEGVMALTVAGEARAYPLQVMMWHEIVNDTVGGVPVAVTYCPLCNSGVAFERTVEERLLTFGTSGRLYADNLVMYDRQTESLWPQLTGRASVGVLTGLQLTAIPMGTVAWSEFLEAHPDAPVLSRDTGFERPYGRNPYVGYDRPDGDLLFALPDDGDARLPVKERVVGLGEGDDSVAVVRRSLAGSEPLELTVGGRAVVVWHVAGQASALDTDRVASGADVGTVGVFVPEVDGRRLQFERDGEGFRDRQTGTFWSVLGRGVSGPLAGTSLEPVRHLDTFWFAWVAFHPGSTLVVAPEDSP